MLRATVAGSAYLGVFASVLGDAVVLRADVDRSQREDIADELGVTAVPTTIGGGTTVGSLVAGNADGAVVSGQITESERTALEDVLERPVAPLPGRLNAAGNLVLANGSGGLVHPDLSEEALDVIRDTLAVPIDTASLGGVQTVGMAAVATDAGVLCHPQATESELASVDDHLGVPADIGTVNHGSPLVGSGLLATTAGYVVGERTTGPELGRIESALDLID